MNATPPFNHALSPFYGAVLFLAFVLIGAAYIVWAKLASVPAVQVTVIPLGLMVLYALALGSARYLRLRDDQAGDNLYYLGFLYTLTSLGVSLWQFSSHLLRPPLCDDVKLAAGAGRNLQVEPRPKPGYNFTA
jgi:hypothetical protein